MEWFNKLSSKDKTILLSLAAIVVLVVIVLVQFILISSTNEESETSHKTPAVTVQNYDEEGENIPDIKRLALNESLYQIIEKNLPADSENVDITKISDIVIRKGSETRGLKTDSEDTYWGRAIIDIKSLKRSFGVYYEWSPDPNTDGYSGYSSMAYCLQEKDLIYGNFDCKEVAWL